VCVKLWGKNCFNWGLNNVGYRDYALQSLYEFLFIKNALIFKGIHRDADTVMPVALKHSHVHFRDVSLDYARPQTFFVMFLWLRLIFRNVYTKIRNVRCDTANLHGSMNIIL
jgi:hypothetical protein